MRRGELTGRLDAIIHDPNNVRVPKSCYPVQRLFDFVAKSFSGGTPSKSNAAYWIGEIPWASPKDFSDTTTITTTEDHISEDGRKAASLDLAPARSLLLVVRSGVLKHTLPVAVCSVPMTVNQDVKVLWFGSELLPEYVAEWLRIHQTQVLRLVCKHSTTVQSINTAEFEQLMIPVPPVAKQRELVKAMETARAARRAKLAEADTLLTSLDRYLLDTLALTPPLPDTRKVFSISLGRVANRLDPHFHLPHFAQIERLLTDAKAKPLAALAKFSRETWEPSEHPHPTFRYLEISKVDTDTGEAAWEEVATAEAPSRARMAVQEGDIIVSLTRPHYGAIAQITAELDGCTASTGFAVLRGVNEKEVLADYLWCVLRTQLCLQQMLQRSSGGNYPAITEAELANVLIPIPNLATQTSIAAEVRRRREQARALRTEAETGWAEAKRWFEEQLLGPAKA